jgi:hypothetical protein
MARVSKFNEVSFSEQGPLKTLKTVMVLDTKVCRLCFIRLLGISPNDFEGHR